MTSTTGSVGTTIRARGGVPDVGLLDEKQQAILAAHRDLGFAVDLGFPEHVRRSCGRTLDILLSRLSNLERRAA